MDIAFSITMFLLIFVFVFFAISRVGEDYNTNKQIYEMNMLALSISDYLVRRPGIPAEWNRSNVEVIGLAREENILDRGKVNEMMSMGYDELKKALGTGNYEAYIELTYLNSSIVKNETGYDIVAGQKPNNASYVAVNERYCIYEGKIVRLRLTVWKT